MYRQIEKFKDIGGYFYVEGLIYDIKEGENEDKGKRYFQELSLKGEVLWQSEESNVYSYHVNQEVIIFNLKTAEETAEDILIYDRKTKKLIAKTKIKLFLYIDECFEGNILYNIDDDNVIVFDILEGKVLSEKNTSIKGITAFLTDEYIVNYSNTYTYIYVKNDLSLLWQQNIQDFFPGEEELSILEIYSYKDTFIIIARVGIVCLSQKDGSLIWKCDYYARTMEIVGHYGYVCTSLSFYRVDLDNGEKYGYGRKYDRLPDFEYNGENHWPSGHRVVYHKGLLWYDVHTSKHPFIIAIDPETATYQWIYEIKDTYEDIEEIRFYDNKMFVTDTGNNLFIYEEEI